jgi:hypothetical protein
MLARKKTFRTIAMVAFINQHDADNFLARVTDIAYQALLTQGLSRPFVDVELSLWQEIRAAYRATAAVDAPAEEDR